MRARTAALDARRFAIGKYLRSEFLLPVLGTAAVVLSLVGWLRQGEPLGDAVFDTLGVLTAGGSYADSSKWAGNGWIGIGRWFGFAFFLLTAKKAFGLLLSNQIADRSAQWRRHEVALVGDHPAFESLARIVCRQRPVLWIASETQARRKGLRIVPRRWTPALIRSFRLHRTRIVVVGYRADDLQAVAVARALAERSPTGEIVLLSPELGAHEALQKVETLHGVRLLSPEMALARSLHRTFPAFRIAQDAGRGRIHALIVGGGELGEQLLRDLVLSSLTPLLGKPRITLVDPCAEEILASLKVRAPELECSVEIAPLNSPGRTDPRALPTDRLAEAAEALAFTHAYVCLADDRAAMSTALTLEQVSLRLGWRLGRIFVRQQSSGIEPRAAAEPAALLVPFGTSGELAEGLGLIGNSVDRVARALHEAYRAFAPEEAVASLAWEDLSEDMREANRALLMHLPAKLASVGMDPRDPRTVLPEFAEALHDPALVERLAQTEHERWMAQRRLKGWQHGVIRDDARRLHPDLVPYAALPEAAREKDRQIVRALARALAGEVDQEAAK